MSGGTGNVLAPMLHFPGLEPDWSRLVCGDANRVAAGLAARPEAWAGPALCITGPRACGLTYMGRAWARRFRGRFLAPDAFAGLARADLDAAGADRVALDDAESVSRWPEDQLLSLLNIAGVRDPPAFPQASVGLGDALRGSAFAPQCAAGGRDPCP